jgi:hypothetical protein
MPLVAAAAVIAFMRLGNSVRRSSVLGENTIAMHDLTD